MSSYKIGILSDTHGLLRPEVLEQLQGCEVIFHGGDINKQSILEKLEQIAPVYVVRGNNDKDWAVHLPETQSIELHGLHFFMIHDKKKIVENIDFMDVIIYGHSHRYEEIYVGKQLWLNPGSCGPRRFSQPVTMAIMEIEENGSFHIRKIDLLNKLDATHVEEDIPEKLKVNVHAVMKDIQNGKTVKQIAKRYGISETLAEQICRFYYTHPGIDAEGIMKRMGL